MMIHPLTKTSLQCIPISSNDYMIDVMPAGDPFNEVSLYARSSNVEIQTAVLATSAAAKK